MDDFFDTFETDEEISRLDHLKEQRGKRNRLLILILLLITSALMGMTVTLLVFNSLSSNDPVRPVSVYTENGHAVKAKTEEKDVPKKAGEIGTMNDEPQIKRVINLLIVGSDEIGGQRKARGLMLAKIDLLSGAIKAVDISERTYMDVQGLGLDQIGESLTMGLDSTKKAVEDLLHVQADAHIILKSADYRALVIENRFQLAFDKAVETSFTEDEKKLYSKEISAMSNAETNVTPLPVKYISINGKPYYEPDYEELSRLLMAVWGIKVDVRNDTARVIVLNGSGLPGVGRTVADKLKSSGFMVVGIENASSFNYDKTRIVAYKEDYMDKARVVQQVLGVGEVIYYQVSSQNVAEIAIIIGKDLKPTN